MQWNLHSQQPTTTNGYSGNKPSPTAIGAAVAVHVAVAAVIMTMPATIFKPVGETPFWGYAVPETDDPPPIPPPPPAQDDSKADKPVTTTDTSPFDGTADRTIIFDTSDQLDGANTAGADIIVPVDPPKPIFLSAKPDPRYLSDFQPDYPGAMIRAEIEGFAKVRVFIAATGRVDAVELIEATEPAFWEATRRQALKRWRFKPATRGGIAVPSEQVMTVRFRLSDL